MSPSPLAERPTSSFYREWKLASGRLIDLSEVIEVNQLFWQGQICHLSGQTLQPSRECLLRTRRCQEFRNGPRRHCLHLSGVYVLLGTQDAPSTANCIMICDVWGQTLDEFSRVAEHWQSPPHSVEGDEFWDPFKISWWWQERFHQDFKRWIHFQRWG